MAAVVAGSPGRWSGGGVEALQEGGVAFRARLARPGLSVGGGIHGPIVSDRPAIFSELGRNCSSPVTVVFSPLTDDGIRPGMG